MFSYTYWCLIDNNSLANKLKLYDTNGNTVNESHNDDDRWQ